MKRKVNRSELVRDYLRNNPKSSVSETVAALKDSGVTKSTVYQVRNGLKNRNSKETPSVAKPCSETIAVTPTNQTVDTSDITVTDLRAVAELRDSLGGMCNLKRAMETLETLVSN